MVNTEHLNQNSEISEKQGVENATESTTNEKMIDSKERKRIQKLIQPSLLPGAVRVKSNTMLVEDEKQSSQEVFVGVSAEKELPVLEEMNEDEEEELENESEYNYSELNKLQLVELLEETVQEVDIQKIKEKVTAIKINFLKLNKEDIDREMEQFILDGGDKNSYVHADDPLEVRFKAAFNIFKENKAKHNEFLEKEKEQNLLKKKEILDQLNILIDSEEALKKTYDDFRDLQDKWKAIGQVPAAEITNLWNSYHFLVEKFFDKVKINRELRDLDLKKNLEAKIELCEKAEELLLEKSITKSFKLLQKYHDEWKEIGPVSADKKDEIWERFKNTTDKINALRRDHYSKIQSEQTANYEAKVALCDKIDELSQDHLTSVGAWQKKSIEVNELFKLWRSIGPAPKKQNEEIWTRFKTAMDGFFDAKKDFFAKLKDQQLENYNKKIQLCVEAEALQESENWRKTTDELKKIQEEWKKIGPVPKRHSDKIWKRFRTACDIFFKRKAEYFSGIKGREDNNLAQKKELIEQIKTFEIKKDRSENMEAVKAFQRKWMEIGFVPMKLKDSIQSEYRSAIDAIFDKMKISENELSTTEYRTIISGIKDDPESRDKMRRERNTLNTRIAKLRDEIQVLENNIGFFSFSKQSEIMKVEYEKKINKAKNDLKVLEAKLKIVNED